MKPPIPKRVVVKIGDVYCVEIEGKYKSYFQYIADDFYQLNSWVIRIFYKRYKIDENPSIEEIIDDKVVSYIHTTIAAGVKQGLWYKVGKAPEIGLSSQKDILFGTTTHYARTLGEPDVDPANNWEIWHLGDLDATFVGFLPEIYWDKINDGALWPPIAILSIFKYGFLTWIWDYNQFKHYPRPDAEIYLKKLQDNGVLTYYHFLGENALQQIEVVGKRVVLLDSVHPSEDDYHLVAQPFSDFKWLPYNFISEQEFKAAWENKEFIFPEIHPNKDR